MRLEIVSGWGENFLHLVQAERIKFVNLSIWRVAGQCIVLTQPLLFLTTKLREEQPRVYRFIEVIGLGVKGN